MKICIILPNLLPMPAVKGGAIERLINDIIDQNESENKLEITVTSMYDKVAECESKKYKNTKFIYIKKDLKYAIKALYTRMKNRTQKKFNTYNEMVLDKIKKDTFDYIVVEDGAYGCFESYLKYFNKQQMILHFHHNGISNKETDETFSTYIGVSNFVANTFRGSSSIKDIQVLKNGIKTEKFTKRITECERNDLRNKLGFDTNDFIVMFCGRLISEKGVMELVQAIKEISISNIKLLIVGSINLKKLQTCDYIGRLNEQIISSNGKIVLTGYIANNELYKYYQSADIGIVPSVCEDAAPLVTIEMMINKLPLIITKSGGAPEYVSSETIILDKDENLIANLKKAIIDLYNNKVKRENMIKMSYEHAKHFSTENFYKDFVGIINRKAGKSE